jgi:hypothetical protein
MLSCLEEQGVELQPSDANLDSHKGWGQISYRHLPTLSQARLAVKAKAFFDKGAEL